MYEFFKPFGVLNFEMGKSRLGEVYILDFFTKQPIMKLQGRIGSNELRMQTLVIPLILLKMTVPALSGCMSNLIILTNQKKTLGLLFRDWDY